MAKILIVDDVIQLREDLRIVLENAGHQVIESENGVQGLQALELNADIDLIICDVNMPEMDGITMCAKIFAKQNESILPIIMLTTEANPELKERARVFGVKAWVTKPLVPDKFLMGLTKILTKYPRQ